MDGLESFAANAEVLTSVFGTWPSFHDAEIVELNIWRGHSVPGEWDASTILPIVTIRFRLLEATQPGATGSGDDALATLRFIDADSISVGSFDDMHCITGVTVTSISRGTFSSGEPLAPILHVRIHTGDRVGASLRCMKIVVVEASRSRGTSPNQCLERP